jgi:Flp pilus assembly protein TadG
MRTWWRRHRRGDRGSLALELSIIAPAIVAMLWMMISAGRVASSASKVEGAARDGARAASINHKGSPYPRLAAERAVQNSLTANGVTCVGPPVVEMTSPNGDAPQPGDIVRVGVTCRVQLLWGANATVHREGASMLDRYRGTQ